MIFVSKKVNEFCSVELQLISILLNTWPQMLHFVARWNSTLFCLTVLTCMCVYIPATDNLV